MSVPRKRAASDLLACRKPAALSVDCMGNCLGMLVLNRLDASVMQGLLCKEHHYHVEYGDP
jgi:hypothetical protein